MQKISDLFNKVTWRSNVDFSPKSCFQDEDPALAVEPWELKSTFMQYPETQNYAILEPNFGGSPKPPDHVRFVCVSDTHSQTDKLSLPKGDVLLHCGDFTMSSGLREITKFNNWLGTLDYEHKVVIAGNHDYLFDTGNRRSKDMSAVTSYLEEHNAKSIPDLISNNCTYLQDSSVNLFGYKIYGAPWQPLFCMSGFGIGRGRKLLEKWKKVPEDTDILMTHGPPFGHNDEAPPGPVGCWALAHEVYFRIKPIYHVFGHIHEGHGVTSNGTTTFVNPSVCTVHYRPSQKPIVFDLPLKNSEDVSKS